MPEAGNELLLRVMREVRSGVSELMDVADIRSGMNDVDEKVNRLAVLLAPPTGHVHRVERRVEALETART